MFYTLRTKLAYSALGKAIATIVRDRYFPKCRVHWVQHAFVDLTTSKLTR